MFKWLNKQGVESDAGFVVQHTGRFTCEYREGGHTLELEVEDGTVGGSPCLSISKEAFSQWKGPCLNNESRIEQQARLLLNFKNAMEFQGLKLVLYR